MHSSSSAHQPDTQFSFDSFSNVHTCAIEQESIFICVCYKIVTEYLKCNIMVKLLYFGVSKYVCWIGSTLLKSFKIPSKFNYLLTDLNPREILTQKVEHFGPKYPMQPNLVSTEKMWRHKVVWICDLCKRICSGSPPPVIPTPRIKVIYSFAQFSTFCYFDTKTTV